MLKDKTTDDIEERRSGTEGGRLWIDDYMEGTDQIFLPGILCRRDIEQGLHSQLLDSS